MKTVSVMALSRRFAPVMAFMLPMAGAFTAPATLSRSVGAAGARSLCMKSSTGEKKGKWLILGGTGFVGARITELALERGYEVRRLNHQPSHALCASG